MGAVTGGAAGAAAGLNITANNYLKHHEYEAMLKELGKCPDEAACDAVFSKYKQISDKRKAELQRNCKPCSVRQRLRKCCRRTSLFD